VEVTMSLDLVFLIDDDAHATSEVSAALESAGYLVWPIADGSRALRLMDRVNPDVILLGGGVATTEWAGFVEELHARASAVPVVFLSNNPLPRRQASAMGASDVVTAPFGGEQLLRAVDRLHLAS